ncbi:tyrosine--tRNA ligase [Atopobium deltae]|uniref:Tyrosine--tRNA ligase n=2 Tax=Atopobium deltae TaxID=1393034 RepID=A0A133XQN0_9ACTN|nr:tyrosine--tRNA ligase [Atopobium deltae]
MQIVPLEELKAKLQKGEPLTIKLGVDPTSPDLHLGHAVPLRKMRQFQDLGHKVTLIIGNGTALIGDPSGRDSTRPPLTEEQVEANAQTYVSQAMKVLDPQKTTIVHNGDWLKSMQLGDMLDLMSKFNVARILEREDFHKRYTNGQSIALHEFIYPVLQAYDSVVVKADVEMGGNDQIFNLLAGRDLMRAQDLEPQVALTVPLLVGLDGTKKMSKSYKNYVGLTDPADDMYGKLMSITDELIPMYYRLCSTLSVDEVDAIDAQFANHTADPYELKRSLARNICDLYHGQGAGLSAQAAFDAQFKRNEVPEDIATFDLGLVEKTDEGDVYLAKLMVELKLATSTGEARRLIDGGGVKINGVAVEAKQYSVAFDLFSAGTTVQAGKRRWARLA